MRWTPVKKKSAWRHALCAGLAGWLSPATLAQGPRPLAWAEALAAVRVETLAWVAAERKHVAHGYPLVSALLCAEADDVQLHAFLEGPLLRALRDKERAVRSAALESLHTAIRFYAALRSRPPQAAPDKLWVAIAAAIAAIPASFRRVGGVPFAVADAAFDAVVSIAACAVQVDSALVLETLLPELLKEEPSSEAAILALRALTSVVSVAGLKLPLQERHNLPPELCAQPGLVHALTRIRRGHAALGELGIAGALPAPLRSALGAIARAASAALTSTAVVAKTSEQALIDGASGAMVCALLDCIPFVIPDEWRSDGALAAALPSFLGCSDAAVRSAGAAALRRAIHAGVGGHDRSSARALLLESTAEYALNCVEQELFSVKSGLNTVVPAANHAFSLLQTLCGDWRAAAALEASEESEHGHGVNLACGLSRIEGAAVVLAAISGDSASTRRVALRLIADVAALGCDIGQPVVLCSELQTDFGSDSTVREIPDSRQWTTAFCEALARAAPSALPAMLAARAQAMRLMDTAFSAVTRELDDRSTAVDLWRAAASVAVSSLSVSESSNQAAERATLVKALIAPLRSSLSPMFTEPLECALRCTTPCAAFSLVAEICSLVADATRAQGLQAAALRHAAALVVRGLAGQCALKAARPDQLQVFVEDALTPLTSGSTGDAVSAVQAVGLQPNVLVCRLAVVETALAFPGNAWPATLRAQLFDACAAWSSASGDHPAVETGVVQGAATSDAFLKDELQRAAADACAALTAGPMTDPPLSASAVLQWAQDALSFPHNRAAARRALCAAASAEPASLTLLLEGAYRLEGSDAAAVHFSALATGIVALCRDGVCSLTLPPVASLIAVAILYSVDTRPQVRRDALALLQALPAGGDSAVLASHTSDLTDDSCSSGSTFAACLGSRLALETPSLCYDTCNELLRRALPILLCADTASAHPAVLRALSMLPAWIEGSSLERTAGSEQTPALLLALFAISCFSTETDALWTALAVRTPNATAMTEFLLEQRRLRLEPVLAELEGLRPLAAQENLCIERCLLAVAAAQPRAVATCLLAALRAPFSDPSDATRDAALVLLSALSAAPPPALRNELRAVTPALLLAALMVLFRGTDPLLDDAVQALIKAPTAASDSRTHVLHAYARKLLDNIVSCGIAVKGSAAMAQLSASLDSACLLQLDTAAGIDAEPNLSVNAVFDALAALNGGSASTAAARGGVLRNACAAEALCVLADSSSHNEASSAAAVLLALRRPLCQASATVLCECVVACLSPGRAGRMPQAADLFASQCIAVLAAAAEVTSPLKLLFHPCVFWAAAAGVRSPSAPLVPHACALLLAFLRAHAAGRPNAPPGVAEEVLLLAAPGVAGLPGAATARGASFPGLARMALRACCTSSSELAPLLLAQLVAAPLGGAADALYGDAEGRLWLGLGGVLPWILAEGDMGVVGAPSTALAKLQAASWLAAGASACRRSSTALVAALEAIAAGACSGLDACEALRAPLALALTASAASLMVASLLEVLRAGQESRLLPALVLLRAVFDAPCGVRPVPDLTPLTAAAAGRHSAAARAALTSALSASTRSGGGAQAPNNVGAASLWLEADAEAAAALLNDALAGAGAKRRDAPSFLFQ